MEAEISFGRWLRQRRKALDLTQEALADRVGCSVSAIRKIESDERRPSRQIAGLLAECLGVPPEEREAFMKVARAELRVERLSAPMVSSTATTPPETETLGRTPTVSLPSPPTPLIGRESELAALSRLLGDAECRLVTLSGPGGIGKTHLAIQAASNQQGNFLDGIFFVPLAPLSSAEYVLPAIANGLSFSFSGTKEPKTQLLDFLREKEMLVVLDNLEHLVSEAGFLAEILQHAPRIKLLVTTRERLNLQGEWVVELRGLPVPPQEQPGEVTDVRSRLILEEYGAVALFANHARRVRPNFQIDAHNQPAIIRICQLMEGNPLGIEMAAAWVRLLSCEEIAAEIEHSLDFLEKPFKDVPERHRSLRAAFDHSWKLLTPEERIALQRISVFRYGFQRAAAIQATGVTLATLTALIDKSLLRVTPTRRYEQHELVRLYASEKLQADPEDFTKTHARHSEYYLQFLQERETRIIRDRSAVEEIRNELENVRSAWLWGLVINRTAALQQGLNGLARFYRLTGLLREGEKVFTEAAQWAQSSVPSNKSVLLSQLLACVAGFLNDRAKYPQAIEAAQRAAELARTLNDPPTEALAHLEWGQALRLQDAYFSARQHINTALSLARANGLTRLEAESLHLLGNVAMFQRDFPEALDYQEQSLQLFMRSGDRHGESAVLKSLGNHYYLSGNLIKAQEYYQTALGIFRETGDRRGESHALNNLGAVTEAQGEYLAAKDYYRQSLAIVAEIGDRGGECAAIANLAHTAYLLGDFQKSIERNEQVIAITREIDLGGTEAVALSNLGLIAYQMGNYPAALDYQHQAEQACEKQEISPALSYIRFRQGRIFFALGMLDEAGEAYQEALDLRRGQGHTTLTLESLAGLAELSLHDIDYSQFGLHAEQIWASLAKPESDILNETDDAFWLYLICYRVFSARQDERATAVLSAGYEQLTRSAARIPAEAEREIFLNSFPSHREIGQTWSEQMRPRKSPGRPSVSEA